MLEIKNKLYQLITLRINGTNYSIEAKSSIVLKNLKLSDLPDYIKTMEKDSISIIEKNEESLTPKEIKRKNKQTIVENLQPKTFSEDLLTPKKKKKEVLPEIIKEEEVINNG